MDDYNYVTMGIFLICLAPISFFAFRLVTKMINEQKTIKTTNKLFHEFLKMDPSPNEIIFLSKFLGHLGYYNYNARECIKKVEEIVDIKPIEKAVLDKLNTDDIKNISVLKMLETLICLKKECRLQNKTLEEIYNIEQENSPQVGKK